MAGGNLEEFDAKFHKGPYDPQEWCLHDGHWKIVKLSDNVYEGHCELCGLVMTEILHVEYWTENQKEDPYIRVHGKKYRALNAPVLKGIRERILEPVLKPRKRAENGKET